MPSRSSAASPPAAISSVLGVGSAHTLPAGQPLHLRVLETPMVVTGLPNVLRAGLVELLQPFLAADGRDAEPPAFTFSAAWDDSTGLWNVLGEEGKFLNGLGSEALLLQQLEWRVISAALEQETWGVFHAGALSRNGATVLVQGNSGAGKTTLTLGLIARGWLPLADDAAIVNPQTLAMRVFPRCFHVEQARRRPVGARPRLARVAAMEGHARPVRWAAEGCQPTAIITVARDATQPSSLTPILRAEAGGALLQGAIRSRLTGSQVADLAARVAASVRFCGHLNNGDLATALDLIEAACAR